MVTISNFASVFEVSIAVHLAYSLITNLHNRSIVTFRKSLSASSKWIDKLDAEQLVTPEEKKDIENSLLMLGMALWSHEMLSEKLVKVFVVTSLIIAFYSLSFLIFLGYCPDQQVSNISMAAILSVSLLPMPIFMLTTYFKMKNRLAPLRDDFTDIYYKINDLIKKRTTNTAA